MSFTYAIPDVHGRLEPGPQMRAADAGLTAENVDGERLISSKGYHVERTD